MPSADLIALAAAVLQVDRSPERVLEIGCGDGERSLFLAREFPRASVRGVDRDADAVREATARVGLDPEGRIAFKHARGALPFPADHFDLVVRRNRQGMLDGSGARRQRREIARVLRPGGELIVCSAGRGDALGRRSRRALARDGFEEVGRGGAGGGTYLVARLP